MIGRNPFKRSVDVPAHVISQAPLGRGERVLAGTQAGDERWLLGTREALYVVAAADPAADVERSRSVGADADVESVETRIPWEQVERVDWNRDEERLVISEVGEFGRVRPQHEFAVSEPGLLLELVRERVTASVVLQRRVFTDGNRGLLVIGRRPPARDGEVFWSYEFDAGVDPDDPDVMVAAEAGLRSAQEELGM